ncbi:MAG: aminopeptidase [Erysipelotrichaceae bacterium]|jgi:aminopeptidase|nr:aminopeptidase [Erysipelotrichaceae bacterium]
MKEKLLRDYARLIAVQGGHVVKGDEVWINAGLDQPEFVTLVVEECYKAGAKSVTVYWHHDPVSKLGYKYEGVSTLGKVSPMMITKYKYWVKKLPTILHIISDDPDAMKGVNQAKVAKIQAKRYPQIKKYRNAFDGKYKWCIAAVPGKAWAKKVFPKLDEAAAVEALWTAILKTSRVDGNDPVKNWDDHNAFLVKQKEKLDSLNLKELYYKSSNGTDFRVELIEGMRWGAGIEHAPNKGQFNPNIPTEEVFTTPMKGKAEGTLVASKPLSYNGELIEDFSVTFKEGKVTAVKARKKQELLEKLVSMDAGAGMLGEVAIVPFESPVNQTGILFYNTLFDENACCHFALGFGFPELYPGALEMNMEQRGAVGINDSMIHVDFMVGTADLSIIGVTKNGEKIHIFKDGTWAI